MSEPASGESASDEVAAGSDDLLGGTALGALTGAQPPQEGPIARALDPQESPLLAPLLGASGGARFSIDLDRAPQAISDLKAAAIYLRKRAELARDLSMVPAPGADGVSQYVMETLGRWAVGDGAGNLDSTLRAGAFQLSTFAEKLEADVRTYFGVDEFDLPAPSSGLLA